MLIINDIDKLPEYFFPISLKLINQYHQKYPRLMGKYDKGIQKFGPLHRGSNININIITCEYKIVISLLLQSYALQWYHTYLLFPGMDRT